MCKQCKACKGRRRQKGNHGTCCGSCWVRLEPSGCSPVWASVCWPRSIHLRSQGQFRQPICCLATNNNINTNKGFQPFVLKLFLNTFREAIDVRRSQSLLIHFRSQGHVFPSNRWPFTMQRWPKIRLMLMQPLQSVCGLA